jgi:hypothetical protein
MWFLGLYQTLLRTHNAIFLSLARIAILAFVLSAIIAGLTYRVSYKRFSQRAFEWGEEIGRSRFSIAALLSWLLDRLWVKEGPERGTFYFVLKTLARSAKHRLYFAAYAAVGLAFAMMGILAVTAFSAQGNLRSVMMRPGVALLSIPLIISFFLLVGMRAAFGSPAELRANWMFQITAESNERKYLAGARKAMIALAIAPLFLLTLVAYTVLWGPEASLLSVLFSTLLSLILMELLLGSFRKIPFTCSHLPGKGNLPLKGYLYWLAFMVYAYSMASLETWMFRAPVEWAVAIVVEIIILSSIISHRNHSFANGAGVEFEDKPLPAVQTLDLNA